jgi:hypothetical protein
VAAASILMELAKWVTSSIKGLSPVMTLLTHRCEWLTGMVLEHI